MQTFFDVLYLISLVITMTVIYIVASQKAGHLQKIMLLICFSALVVNLGFVMKVLAINDDGMLAAQKLIYTAMPFFVFFVFMFVFDYVGFKLPKLLKSILSIYNLCLSFLVVSQNQHNLFYKNYWVVYRDGVRCLKTVYGPFHLLMTITICVYFGLGLLTSVWFLAKNIHKKSMSAWRLLIAVLIPVPAYIIPKVVDAPFEFHSPSIALFVAFLLALIYHDNLYDVSNVASQYIFQSMDEAMVVFDSGFKFKGCNGKAKELFPELVSISLNEDIREVATGFEVFLQGRIKEFEKDEVIYEITSRIITEDKRIIGKVLRFTDVTIERIHTRILSEQKKALESEVVTLADISYHDEMTGLYNRRYYEDKLEEIQNNNELEKVTIVVFDVNGLKQVNDSKGHDVGDELIKGASSVLDMVFGKLGFCCRIGGDEFVAIALDESQKPEEIGKMIEGAILKWNEEKHPVTLSISYGIVKGSDYPGEPAEYLVKKADRKMYEFKRNYYSESGNDRRIR